MTLDWLPQATLKFCRLQSLLRTPELLNLYVLLYFQIFVFIEKETRCEKEKAMEELKNAENREERERLNNLHKEKNQDIIRTLWKIGLYFENNGQINEAKTNLLEALELAEEIEGRRTVEGLPASDLGKAIYVYQVDWKTHLAMVLFLVTTIVYLAGLLELAYKWGDKKKEF